MNESGMAIPVHSIFIRPAVPDRIDHQSEQFHLWWVVPVGSVDDPCDAAHGVQTGFLI
jgi:hypothetical protein